ncbi:MAG TPA: MarR family transcriptional regulator, partial [Leptospiraceae bacterium]|nr:MarR family transcriptional regulator [Leptospiraceae bacterium]
MSEKTVFKEKDADDSPGFLLFKITVLWQKKLGIIFNDLRIQQTQYAILASLKFYEEKNEKCTQAFLVEHARIDKMTL